MMSRVLEVVPYDPAWSKLFEEESSKIKSALRENFISIHHIGSTSVENLAAKPIVDILIIVRDLKAVNHEALFSLGYKLRGRIVTPLSDFYQKGTPQPKFHLHFYEEGDETSQLHLSLCQYLRNHPSERDEYIQLKFDLQNKYKSDNNYNQYRIEKAPFLEKIIQNSGFEGFTLNYIKSDLNNIASEKDMKIFHRLQKDQNLMFSSENQVYFSLKKGLTIVAVAHLEKNENKEVFLRSIAIDFPYSGKGYDKIFVGLLQKWAESESYLWVNVYKEGRVDGSNKASFG